MKALKIIETYEAPVEVVWKALTDKDEMKKWYFDLAEFIPEVGFEFTFEGTGHTGQKYLHLCRIEEVIKYRKLSYSWKYEGIEGASLVTFELVAEGDRTKLILTHADVDTFPKDNPDFAPASFDGGWQMLLQKYLTEHLEKM